MLFMGNIENRTNWQKADDVSHCPGCNNKFIFLLVRKHHCRKCGKVYCDSCSRETDSDLVLEPHTSFPPGKKIRICLICLPLDPEEFWNQAQEDLAALMAGYTQLKAFYSQHNHLISFTKLPNLDRLIERLDEISHCSIHSDDIQTYEGYLAQLEQLLKEKEDKTTFSDTLRLAKAKIVKDWERIQNEENFWKNAQQDLKTIEKVCREILEMKELKASVTEIEYNDLLEQLNHFLENKKQKEFVKVINEIKEKLLNEVEELSKGV